jgi:hypothetical protein
MRLWQRARPRRLSRVDQERVFPNSITFDSPSDQEAFVREWAQKRTGLACSFKVRAGVRSCGCVFVRVRGACG